MARHNEIGHLGEKIAAHWLKSHGFTIVERNYFKKWGEIDIVARETQKVHLIEVKTVSYETNDMLLWAVSHETWQPEDKVHKNKQDRLKRVIQTWLTENNHEADWQIDIIIIRMVPREKLARVRFLENIIFE